MRVCIPLISCETVSVEIEAAIFHVSVLQLRDCDASAIQTADDDEADLNSPRPLHFLSPFSTMKPASLLPSNISTLIPSPSLSPHFTLSRASSTPNSRLFLKPPALLPRFSFKPQFGNHRRFSTLCSLNSSTQSNDSKAVSETQVVQQNQSESQWILAEIRNPKVPPFVSSWSSRFSLSDQATFLLTFIACTTSVAFVSVVASAVPTLYAMARAAKALAKLADTAREELPSTMAAIRLSGMEISDLTLELSDLSQEITEGVNKSAQAVQAAQVGIQQMGALARQQTASMIQERANLPVISLQPVVSSAAKKTSHAVGNAARTIMNIFSRGKSKEDDPH